MSPEMAGFEMFRNADGMWRKQRKVRVQRRFSADGVTPQAGSKHCPKCNRLLSAASSLYKKADGAIVCAVDLSWLNNHRGTRRDTSSVTLFQQETA